MEESVLVTRVHVPAWSTLGYAYGTSRSDGQHVIVVGDHRLMRWLGEGLTGGEDVEIASEWVIARGETADEMASRWDQTPPAAAHPFIVQN